MRDLRILAAAAVAASITIGCGSSDETPKEAPAPTTGATGGGGAGGGGQGGGGEGNAPLDLAPGEVAEIDAIDGAFGARLAAPEGGEKFLLILASTDLSGSTKKSDYAVSLDPAPPSFSAHVLDGCSLLPDAWKDVVVESEPPPTGVGPNVGDTRTIEIPTNAGAEAIQAVALAVGEHSIVWADTTPAHPAEIDPAVVQEFLDDFEQIILPRARMVFGVELDLDGDGRISLVFSPLTYDTAVAFFTQCDLAQNLACASDNDGEYLYLTPPNAIDPPYNTPNAIKEILAHELAHMLHYGRKVMLNDLPSWSESMYMIEGIGGFAQDVLGYQSGNLYVTMAALDGIDAFSLGETLDDGTPYDPDDDGVLRGGSYLFARWMYDRAGGDLAHPDGTIESRGGPALLRSLLDSPESIAAALPTAAGAPIEDLALDFWTTLAVSNRDFETGVKPANACFSYLPVAQDPVTTRQRGADVFASFHGTQQMTGPKLQDLGAVDGVLPAGGAELVRLDAQPGQPEIAVVVSGEAVGVSRLRIARIQ